MTTCGLAHYVDKHNMTICGLVVTNDYYKIMKVREWVLRGGEGGGEGGGGRDG